jgi:hypothetical protein
VQPTRLMVTPPQFQLSRLSKQRYLDFLRQAAEAGFAFKLFRELSVDAPALPERYIVLRHDIEFAPRYSLEMAELEHAAGIHSTFFVLVDGNTYNPLAAETVRQIRRIRELGHEIGLHFAVSSAVDNNLGEEVAFRVKLLSEIAGTQVHCFSQHDPVNAGFAAVTLPPGHHPCINASEVIARHDLLYVSDSAKMWRRYTFETALQQARNLCLLAHPHSWLHPQDDYIAMIRDFEAEEAQRVSGIYDAFVNALAGYYERRQREGV